ncbi:MAG: nucleoside kinase [Muribaculaceae bacterium]|nr:nucleoside kinase [Muribaculaceae bacterium]
MDTSLKIFCKNINEYVEIKGGDTLSHIYDKVKDRIAVKPICARVNNKTEDLAFPVYAPKQVEFLSRSTQSGARVYTRSLCMILYKALIKVLPGARLRIEHSISQGFFCRIKHSSDSVSAEQVEAIKSEMRNIIGRNIPFVRHEKLTTDVIKIFRKAGLNDKVRLLETLHELYTVYYTLGDTVDSYYGPLAPDSGSVDVFDLVPYHEGMLLLGFSSADNSVPEKPIKQEKMFKAFTEHLEFNNIIGISDVGNLNRAVYENASTMLINVAEALHGKMIGKIAADIAERFKNGGSRVVLIAGPSSSGKTTSTKRLAIELMTNLIKPQMISLDNYFVSREQTPRDETGDYDYESLYALDLEKFNSDLNALINGEEVEMPTYSFELGKRLYKGDKMKLKENEILLIEGIHGLNPELTKQIPDNQKYKVYISALTTLSIDDHNWVPTSDNRLLRRIIRDYKYRGTSATNTIARWRSVRAGEEKWIFPFQENADATFNSSLIFELGVMKNFAEPILKSVPHNVPEFSEAYRLLTFLSYFEAISERQIPSTSLLREFLGGSSFNY